MTSFYLSRSNSHLVYQREIGLFGPDTGCPSRNDEAMDLEMGSPEWFRREREKLIRKEVSGKNFIGCVVSCNFFWLLAGGVAIL